MHFEPFRFWRPCALRVRLMGDHPMSSHPRWSEFSEMLTTPMNNM